MGPAMEKIEKIMKSAAGKRASKILQASDSPAKLVERALEVAVEDGLIESSTIDIPTLFTSPLKKQKMGGGTKQHRKRQLSDVLNQGSSGQPPSFHLAATLESQRAKKRRKKERRARAREAALGEVKNVLHI